MLFTMESTIIGIAAFMLVIGLVVLIKKKRNSTRLSTEQSPIKVRVVDEKSAETEEKGEGEIKPISVNYHFTRQCNYKCGFCFHTAKTSFVLPLEEAKKGLTMLKENGKLHLYLLVVLLVLKMSLHNNY